MPTLGNKDIIAAHILLTVSVYYSLCRISTANICSLFRKISLLEEYIFSTEKYPLCERFPL
jgi:hypothetical protein